MSFITKTSAISKTSDMWGEADSMLCHKNNAYGGTGDKAPRIPKVPK
jgi:hypothetical protein